MPARASSSNLALPGPASQRRLGSEVVLLLVVVSALVPTDRSSGESGAHATLAGAPVVDHTNVSEFLALTDEEIAAAAALRVLFIDHSVGANISDGLDCTASASMQTSPSRCTRFEHVSPDLSADPAAFRFGAKYDRSRWTYHAGGGSYWRDWPAYVEGLLAAGETWDVVIPMPSYLVAPNGGWGPIETLEAAHPEVVFVYATSSLPRGAAGGTGPDQTMERFNADARTYALAHDKALLDVADVLGHDYRGSPCYDTRDGVEYCQTPDRCENLPDDGVQIPAICQHYTTELHGGHLGSVSGGALRMAQAMWLLMARLAGTGEVPGPSPAPVTTAHPTDLPTATATDASTARPSVESTVSATAVQTGLPTDAPTVTPVAGTPEATPPRPGDWSYLPHVVVE